MNRFGDFSDHSASMHAHPISDAYAGGASCGSRPTEHNLVRNVKASKTYTSYTDGNTYTHGRAYTNGQQHMSPMDNLRGGQHHYGGSGRPYHGGSGRQHRAGATGGGQRPRDPRALNPVVYERVDIRPADFFQPLCPLARMDRSAHGRPEGYPTG